MVAALNIVASLILLVMEKHRDIAILKTMGASARSVTLDLHDAGADHRHRRHDGRRDRRATSLSSVLDRYQLIRVPMDVYQVSHVPFTVLPLDFALVVVGGGARLLRRDDLSRRARRRASIRRRRCDMSRLRLTNVTTDSSTSSTVGRSCVSSLVTA